jgi:hypothetical protein
MNSKLHFRAVSQDDAKWIAEGVNDPGVARYLLNIYPNTEHEIREEIKSDIRKDDIKILVGEIDGNGVGVASLHLEKGRCRHNGWIGIWIKRDYWGKGYGKTFMGKIIDIGKAHGLKRLMLGVFEPNKRAIKLYRKYGFKEEAYIDNAVFIDGEYVASIVMALFLEPIRSSKPSIKKASETAVKLNVRYLKDEDLDEINRLQNCEESTKNTKLIPPIPKEVTKKWYEEIDSGKGVYCNAAFKDDTLLGYIRFVRGPPPYTSIWIDELLVDVNESPIFTAEKLVESVLLFRDRYNYRSVMISIPENSYANHILKRLGFRSVGKYKGYYRVDDEYIDSMVYVYP